MKKVISIIVALALSLALVTAMPVAADVHSVSAVPLPDRVGKLAEYTIAFNITTTLAIGDYIFVEFPDDTTVPATYATDAVTVQDAGISSGDIIRISAREVRIRLPIGIGAPGRVTVVFTENADIKNPTAPGEYTLSVKTSQETTYVTSPKYQIRLSDKSTYKFDYEFPDMIWVGYGVELDVAVKTHVLGLEGYDNVRIKFFSEDGPGVVQFEGWDGEDWVLMADDWWPPEAGDFKLEKDDEKEFAFRLTFDTVGIYSIVLQLFDVAVGENKLEEAESVVPVAGVSVAVNLTKGWNLMSLPIIPSDPAIRTVLDEIIDDVVTVWYHDPTIPDPTKRDKSFDPKAPTNDLEEMEDGKAYWVHMREARTLTVVGVAFVLPGQFPSSYSVEEGWNMIGFRSTELNITADDYLKGTEFVRIYRYKAGKWDSLHKDEELTPGLGYWIAFSKPGVIYP